jgi:hypothetical protein
MKLFHLLGSCFVATFLLGPVEFSCIAQELSPSQLRAVMQSEREKIISGEFSAKFRQKVSSSAGALLDESKGQWNVRFDYSMGWFVFERLDSGVDGAGEFRSFYYEDELSYFTFSDIEGFAKHYIKGESKNSPDGSIFKKLDVRGLGFFNTGNIVSNSNEGDRMFFEHLHVRKYSSEIKVASESNRVRKLWFDHAYGSTNTQINLWVDQSKDFIPIRATTQTGGRPGGESVTVWDRLNGVMVPTRLSSVSYISFIPEGKEEIEENLESRTEELELDVTWKSLNENVGEFARIDYRTFGFPKGTRVFLDGKLEHIYGVELPKRN